MQPRNTLKGQNRCFAFEKHFLGGSWGGAPAGRTVAMLRVDQLGGVGPRRRRRAPSPPLLPPSPPDQPASHPPLAGSTPPPPPLQHGGLHTQQPQQEGGREPEDPGAGVGEGALTGEAGAGVEEKGASPARQEVSKLTPIFHFLR